MAVTKTIIQNSPSRTTVKVVGTAGADTSTIVIKSANLTVGVTGNVTFDATAKSVTRASGSWIDAGFVPGTVVTFSGTTSNNIIASVVSVTALTIVLDRRVVSEVAAAATVVAYNSDLAYVGQTFTTPFANISSIKYSLGGSCSVVRNSITVLNLYGSWMALNDGFGLAEQADQNLVVTFGTSGGTLIIELAKMSGYQTESQRFDI